MIAAQFEKKSEIYEKERQLQASQDVPIQLTSPATSILIQIQEKSMPNQSYNRFYPPMKSAAFKLFTEGYQQNIIRLKFSSGLSTRKLESFDPGLDHDQLYRVWCDYWIWLQKVRTFIPFSLSNLY